MNVDANPDDGAWERLLRGFQKKEIPPADCPQCGQKSAAAPVAGLPRRQTFGGGADYTFGVCRECGELCGLEVMLVSRSR